MKKYIPSFLAAAFAVLAFTVPELAMAAGEFDPATATSGSSASTWIQTAANWMLGVVVIIWGVRRVLGFFGK